MIFCTLNKLLKDNGITQTKIAEKTGISRPTLLSLLRNDNQSIRYETIEELCNYFDINMNQLLIHSKFKIEYEETKIYEDTSIAIQTDGELARFTVITSFLINGQQCNFENDVIINNLDISETLNINGGKNLELTCSLTSDNLLVSKKDNSLLIEKDIFELFINVFEIDKKIMNLLPVNFFETVSLEFEIIKNVEKRSIDSIKEFIDSLTAEDKSAIFDKLNEELNQ